MMSIRYAYETAQLDLACLDTMHGDHSEYGRCLAFAWASSSVAAIEQMFEANGACAFDTRDPETYEECRARWAAEDRRMAA